MEKIFIKKLLIECLAFFYSIKLYDMAGNVLEWNTEVCTNNGTPCTTRGGSYYYNDSNTITHDNGGTDFRLTFVSFRSILYL